MKNKYLSSSLVKIISVIIAAILTVTMMSGCAIGPLKLDFLDSLFKKSDVNYIYSLDSALAAAALQEEDNGNVTASNTDSTSFSISCDEGKFAYDFEKKSAKSDAADFVGERLFNFTSGEFEYSGDVNSLSEEYNAHIADMCTASPRTILANVDDDEENELIITTVGFARTDSFATDEAFSDIVTTLGFTCLFIDIKDGVASYQTNHIPYEQFDATSAAAEKGFLLLLNDKNDKIPTSIVTDTSAIENIDSAVNNYATLLEKCGRDDIRVKDCNITENDNNEVFFSYQFGSDYRIEAFAIIDNNFSKILNYNTQNDHYGLFLLYDGNIEKFFIYNQNVTSEYTLEYNYLTYSLDSDYKVSKADSAAISVDTRESVSVETNNFFESVTTFLSYASVCYDPYKLTGYHLMFSDYVGDYNRPDYVAISNCSTNKSGYVLVDDGDTWLNLREGPSKKYDRVLMDPNDKKSYVKQSLFSPVTIIQPYNTGDEDNPIWVEIEINYMDCMLVGFSSQNYVVIPGIRHLAVGDSFQIEFETNSDSLYWASTDSAVASVDSNTGMVYANAPGLVLVSVTTDEGNYDSCLLMIE